MVLEDIMDVTKDNEDVVGGDEEYGSCLKIKD